MATGKALQALNDDTRDYSEMNVAHLRNTADLDTFESALSALAEAGITVEEFVGDGFDKEEKEKLVNKKLLLIEWQFSNPGNEKYNRPYVTVRGITEGGDRFRFSDGSTGICAQLIEISVKRIESGTGNPNAGLIVKNGLTRSDYTVDLPDPKTGELIPTPASTFYLAQ